MDRQVYRREDVNKWVCLDATMRPGKDAGVVGFESVTGFSAKDVYAAGWGGEIWRFDGSKSSRSTRLHAPSTSSAPWSSGRASVASETETASDSTPSPAPACSDLA